MKARFGHKPKHVIGMRMVLCISLQTPRSSATGEFSATKATMTKFERTLEEALISFDFRQLIARFDETQIIQGSFTEQEDGSAVYTATLKGESLLPDSMDWSLGEQEREDAQAVIKIVDGYATELTFHYVFNNEEQGTKSNMKVQFDFSKLGSVWKFQKGLRRIM